MNQLPQVIRLDRTTFAWVFGLLGGMYVVSAAFYTLTPDTWTVSLMTSDRFGHILAGTDKALIHQTLGLAGLAVFGAIACGAVVTARVRTFLGAGSTRAAFVRYLQVFSLIIVVGASALIALTWVIAALAGQADLYGVSVLSVLEIPLGMLAGFWVATTVTAVYVRYRAWVATAGLIGFVALLFVTGVYIGWPAHSPGATCALLAVVAVLAWAVSAYFLRTLPMRRS